MLAAHNCIYMNFISPNTAAQYNIECKIEIQNIQVIQKKLHILLAFNTNKEKERKKKTKKHNNSNRPVSSQL